MNLKEKKYLQKLIYDIYYNGEDPIKFYEATGLENYMEELYPSDEKKLVGDWISERFNVKNFLKLDELNQAIVDLKDLFLKTRFYCNIPTGKTLNKFINDLEEWKNKEE